jgi:AraC-like DNA-binding protein
MSELFIQVSGVLPPGSSLPVGDEGKVVLSNLSSGGTESSGQATSGIKYVATGVEVYRYGGKTYPVKAGQFLYVPERHGGEVEIGRSDASTTLGLCVYLPKPQLPEAGAESLDRPMIFPAACSTLGRVLSGAVAQMQRCKPQRAAIARVLLGQVANDIEPLMEETVRLLSGIDALKPSTRHETLRRLNIARGYLHEVTDRSVELAELAKVAGISRFQLLRNFRDAFGAPPAGSGARRLDRHWPYRRRLKRWRGAHQSCAKERAGFSARRRGCGSALRRKRGGRRG